MDIDPRQKQWKLYPLPTQPIILKIGPENPAINLFAVGRSYRWKTNKKKPIPFPENKNPDYMELVRGKLLSRFVFLEGFFSKTVLTNLLLYYLKYNIILELNKLKTGSPPIYKIFIKFLPFEKKIIDKLLRIGFIEPYMQADPTPVLFVFKPHFKKRRFCTNYR